MRPDSAYKIGRRACRGREKYLFFLNAKISVGGHSSRHIRLEALNEAFAVTRVEL